MRTKSAQPVPAREDGTLPPKRPPAPSIRRRPGQSRSRSGARVIFGRGRSLSACTRSCKALLGLLTLGLVTGVYS